MPWKELRSRTSRLKVKSDFAKKLRYFNQLYILVSHYFSNMTKNKKNIFRDASRLKKIIFSKKFYEKDIIKLIKS